MLVRNYNEHLFRSQPVFFFKSRLSSVEEPREDRNLQRQQHQ